MKKKYKIFYSKKSKTSLRDYLALERTHLANQRTFLSMFRTGLYFLMIGLTVMTFENFDYIMHLAPLFFIIGLIFIGQSIYQYYKTKSKITKSYDMENDQA